MLSSIKPNSENKHFNNTSTMDIRVLQNAEFIQEVYDVVYMIQWFQNIRTVRSFQC